MRKAISILLLMALVLCFAGCKETINHDQTEPGKITYTYGSLHFTETLTNSEISQILNLLNGKMEVPFTPDCGFSASVSFSVGVYTYALAQDGCPLLYNCTTERCITLSDEEHQIVESLFISRGGVFPCS